MRENKPLEERKKMKKIYFTLGLILSIYGFNSSAQSFYFEQNIAASSDDAEEKHNGSYVTTSSSDIEMIYDNWNEQGLQTVGLRFDQLTIPASANIENAYIQFTADASNSSNISLTIKGEDNSNSPTFANTINNISGRATTSTSILWEPMAWSENTSGTNERSPNLSNIITEVITSNGWQSGNPITFILTGTGNEFDNRKANSYDESISESAKLVVEYTPNLDQDVAINSILSPSSVTYPESATLIQVELISYGNQVVTDFSLSYYINNDLIATEICNQTLSIGQSLAFTFAQTADLSSLGTYHLTVELSLENDEEIQNNFSSKTITVIDEIDVLFFEQGSSWCYWDAGSNPNESWNATEFDDSQWPVGISQFGYGEADEATVLASGKTVYFFRKKILIPDLSLLSDVFIHMVHDDGAIVYVNGLEAIRTEMIPMGTISLTTAARQSINETHENNFYTYKINSNYFLEGMNTIAVSLHNRSSSDNDLSFDCFISSSFQYHQDGPYVYYDGDNIIVEEIGPEGLTSNAYSSADGLELTCELPHMGTSFSFYLKSNITPEPSIDPSSPSKFLAISDFDGHIEGFTMILKGEGIIDNEFNWIYGSGHLIISGDLFDRGFHITECMWLLYKLEKEAEAQGGKVHLIIGNHEIMNMTDDWRYVEVKYFNNAHLMGKRMSELYNEKSELGRWLRSKNIIEKIGDYAFLHGGISPQLAALDLTYDEINAYGRIEMNGETCPSSACEIVNGSNGIYWSREMVYQNLTQAQVDEFLDSLDVQRVILGHTKDQSIRSLYNDRVMAIDMYHVNNFNNGYMESLQFELGCFYVFHTENLYNVYTQLGNCDPYVIIDESTTEESLKIYPNPTSNLLNIRLPKAIMDTYMYTVLDMQGKIISSGEIHSDQSVIDLNLKTKGNYILKIENSERIIKGNFILK